MSDYPEVPPWQPIADWLARLPQEPQEDMKQKKKLPSNATRQQLRKRYELEAKAIAYDISVADRGGYGDE